MEMVGVSVVLPTTEAVMLLRVTAIPPFGESVVNPPPIRILPSGWTTTTSATLLVFGLKPSSADCPRTAAEPPASSTKTESSKNLTFLVLDVALAHEVNAATWVAGNREGIARNLAQSRFISESAL